MICYMLLLFFFDMMVVFFLFVGVMLLECIRVVGLVFLVMLRVILLMLSVMFGVNLLRRLVFVRLMLNLFVLGNFLWLLMRVVSGLFICFCLMCGVVILILMRNLLWLSGFI